ncbi:MAG: hydroxylamine reductase [Desulfotalea sp.]
MFCNQCEQTAKGTGCEKVGVCGKNDGVASLQDLLTYNLQGLSLVIPKAQEANLVTPAIKHFIVKGVFSCLTNVDFDPKRFHDLITEAVQIRNDLLAKLGDKAADLAGVHPSLSFVPAPDVAGLSQQGQELNFIETLDANEDLRSLKQTILYGLRGLAAYTDHATILGQEDDEVYNFIFDALAKISTDLSLEELVSLAMAAGSTNLRAMELLDAGNTGTYGHPVPTPVPLGTKAGKAILITGHDLKDLHALLVQTEGKGINVYTHGEMLPCHGYPELSKFDHLVGHYGTAWQNQKVEMAAFPGAVLFTTNCIQKPAESYKDNVFTTGLVGWPDVKHVESNTDFSAVIAKALDLPGFTEDTENGQVLAGFGRNAVLGVADKVIDAVKAGDIRHFFLVGGCDGAKPGRNYYTDFVEQAPKDTIIMTLACGKFRFFDKDLGDIGGIPRLLDIGQCNDAYSAIQIAVALAGAFECEVNDLPLSMILSWYEQKAVIILLTLLSLGISDIRLGPTLPAFITPNILNFLVENFAIKPIAETAAEDLKTILG